MDNEADYYDENPLESLWAHLAHVDYRDDDILANIIEDDDDYDDEYFDPDEFE
ncbi:MAG: hypothetical protein K2L33_07485 [Muribaculaceae bacterium]|nr:hypothetical protein [Muribaculaceae bacterium]